MTILEWLLKGDPSLQRITKQDLLHQESQYVTSGYIDAYLHHFNQQTSLFSDSLYSPKWTSTFYTALELANLRIDPNNAIYQAICEILYQQIWVENKIYKSSDKRDVCIIGMLLYMLSYGQIEESKLKEMINFLLHTQLHDGGWNCRYNKYPKPSTSSLHTTISVLEGIEMYVQKGYQYQKSQLLTIREKAHEFMLLKDLFRSRRTKQVIHQDMMKFHYPHRWKYDCYRALDYFQTINFPYDPRMEEALLLLKKQITKGYIHRGKQYNGTVYFHLETGKKGRFTTLEALRILQCYDKEFYQFIIRKEFSYL